MLLGLHGRQSARLPSRPPPVVRPSPPPPFPPLMAHIPFSVSVGRGCGHERIAQLSPAASLPGHASSRRIFPPRSSRPSLSLVWLGRERLVLGGAVFVGKGSEQQSINSGKRRGPQTPSARQRILTCGRSAVSAMSEENDWLESPCGN